jgi:hypothetical protein
MPTKKESETFDRLLDVMAGAAKELIDIGIRAGIDATKSQAVEEEEPSKFVQAQRLISAEQIEAAVFVKRTLAYRKQAQGGRLGPDDYQMLKRLQDAFGE